MGNGERCMLVIYQTTTNRRALIKAPAFVVSNGHGCMIARGLNRACFGLFLACSFMECAAMSLCKESVLKRNRMRLCGLFDSCMKITRPRQTKPCDRAEHKPQLERINRKSLIINQYNSINVCYDSI